MLQKVIFHIFENNIFATNRYVKKLQVHFFVTIFLQVKYRTIDKSAFHGKDFEGGEGVILFRSGETAKDIKIPIIDDMSASGTDEYFEVKQLHIFCLPYKLIVIVCRLSYLSSEAPERRGPSSVPSPAPRSPSPTTTSTRRSWTI